MASNIYLQIDGIKGESTDSEHKDWIEILSFSHGISQPATATGTIRRTNLEDFVVTKHVDIASPKLYEACASGKHINKVVTELRRASGGTRVKYLTIEMDQVVVSRVHLNADASDDLPKESVSFNYGTIKWTYTQQNRADGSEGGNATGGWSVLENKTV